MAFSTLVTDLNSLRPSDAVCEYMADKGFVWNKTFENFHIPITGSRVVYPTKARTGATWAWTTGKTRCGNFDSPITAYVNAELAGWE
jgi:hypothetical protein